jgi:undecaprenyl-diphosphatase
MSIVQAIILGLVQGITELLPISSSTHLILIPKFFGWEPHSLAFDTTLHLGTAFALIIYFRKEIFEIVVGFTNDLLKFGFNFKNYSQQGLLGIKILIGSIPAGIIGFMFGDVIENSFRGVGSVIIFLLFGSLLMLAADIFSKPVVNNIEGVSTKKSFIVGLFQSFALFSGISRSGSTISGGMLLGLRRDLAAKVSFLLSIPVVLLAGISQGVSSFGNLSLISPLVLFFGFICSFLSGLIAIKFLMGFLGKNKLTVFIVYRLILVLFIIFSLRL